MAQTTAIRTLWMGDFVNHVRPDNPAAKGVAVSGACPVCSVDPSPNPVTSPGPQAREPKAIVATASGIPATSDWHCGDCESSRARAKDEELDEPDEGQQSYERVEEALGRAAATVEWAGDGLKAPLGAIQPRRGHTMPPRSQFVIFAEHEPWG